MKYNRVGHGCLLVVLAWSAVAVAAPMPDGRLVKVRSKVFDIGYRVNEESLPLESVRLWYTRDKGSTWQLYGRDEDAQSPISFNAPSEGVYGFYLVAGNAAGISGGEPQAGTEPQQWAYVDFTPPIVQLRRPKIDPRARDGAVSYTHLRAHET